MMIDFEKAKISSPKRTHRRPTSWDSFFPYYAGFPTTFAHDLIETLQLPKSACVLDPWNGSGTTTYVSGRHFRKSIGIDINPVMIVVARARCLAPSEADSLYPLALDLMKKAKSGLQGISDDPLLDWFDDCTVIRLRSIEISLRNLLVGPSLDTGSSKCIDRISSIASTLYAALFRVCRTAAKRFQASNPTWFKRAIDEQQRIHLSEEKLEGAFINTVREMAHALDQTRSLLSNSTDVRLYLGDSTEKNVRNRSIDLVLTSPPYCTRIDYTAATRIELAIILPLLSDSVEELGHRMLGSTRVPKASITAQDSWGPTCIGFIEEVASHRSKASSGYYKKTHLDYFDKAHRSLKAISDGLRDDAGAVFVVQDSFYKDVHNDLAKIFVEMGSHHGLHLCRRDDFRKETTLAASHPHSRHYSKPRGAVESVLCFRKS